VDTEVGRYDFSHSNLLHLPPSVLFASFKSDSKRSGCLVHDVNVGCSQGGMTSPCGADIKLCLQNNELHMHREVVFGLVKIPSGRTGMSYKKGVSESSISTLNGIRTT
jgi:hypothetical protein